MCSMIELLRSSSSCLVCIKWMSSLQVTGYSTNYVEQSVTGGLCSSVKPDFQLCHPSATQSACLPVGVFFSFLSWMYIFVRVNAWFFFLAPCWCVTFRPQHFCFYSYHQCFQPPLPFLPISSKAPVSLSCLHQPSHSAKTTDVFIFKNGFSFLLLSFFFIIVIIIIIIIVKCIWRKYLSIIL